MLPKKAAEAVAKLLQSNVRAGHITFADVACVGRDDAPSLDV